MKILRIGSAILAALVALAACGQRGPLVMPQPSDAPSAPTGNPKDPSRG